ncbi:MAG: GntR family transcriptional regulator [Gammaproteobacteria bacterium]|nr:MAG: GntR family transcriptional regulator [Gammaproteobacteria bacterium]
MLERLVKNYEEVHARRPRGMPKYLCLCEVFEGEIAAGRLAPGDKLPSEVEFADVLPASLGTIQKALGALAERGVLVRKQGKGTFVSSSRIDNHWLWHLRFLGDDGELLPVWLTVHAVERGEQRGLWSDFLGSHPYYIHIRRRMNVNNEFSVLGQFVVPGPRFHGLLDIPPQKLDGTPLRELLSARFGAPTLRVEERIGFEPASDAVCTAIDLPRGSVALLCHVLGYGVADVPLYFQIYHVPPNRRRLEVRERKP